jgi:hypothetical protein
LTEQDPIPIPETNARQPAIFDRGHASKALRVAKSELSAIRRPLSAARPCRAGGRFGPRSTTL